jgi:RNA polymerase sigma-70 factor, ECF subfamily
MDEARADRETGSSAPTDYEWVEAAKAGSQEAFAGLVRRYQDRLYSFLLQKVGNRQDAEDIAQATFVAAYRRLADYESRGKFGGWLFTMAHHRAVSHHRSFFRRQRLHAQAETEAASESGSPALAAEAKDDSSSLWGQARGLLNESQQTALWLHYAEGMSTAEIGEVLGKKPVAVKVMLHRARKKLAAHLTRSHENSSTAYADPQTVAAVSRGQASQRDSLRPKTL